MASRKAAGANGKAPGKKGRPAPGAAAAAGKAGRVLVRAV